MPVSNTGEEDRVIAEALAILERRHAPGEALANPADVRAYLRLRLAERRFEIFGCLYLDTKHRVIAREDLFTGTIDGASVYPRVVAQRALEHNAAALIAYHQHPSGDPTPSRADEQITQRLKDALALLDIRLLDHLVVAAEGSVSMAECGLM
ncbi:MAG: JAB domain-containing protein [Gammaproteobacteria bacterium]